MCLFVAPNGVQIAIKGLLSSKCMIPFTVVMVEALGNGEYLRKGKAPSAAPSSRNNKDQPLIRIEIMFPKPNFPTLSMRH